MKQKSDRTARKKRGFADRIFEKLTGGLFGTFFSSYDAVSTKFSNGIVRAALAENPLARKLILPFFARLDAMLEGSYFLALLRRFFLLLRQCRLRSYGIFLFSFGLYTTAIYCLNRYILQTEADMVALLCGAALVLASLPLLFSRGKLADAILESPGLSFFCIHIVGLRQGQIAAPGKSRGRSSVFFVLGMSAGVLSMWISPLSILAFLAATVAVLLIFTAPQFGVVLMVFCLPFAPTMMMAGLSLVVFASYLVKLIRRKRTFRFSLMDFFVLLFGALLLLGGFVSVRPEASLPPAVLFVILMLGYFAAVNLIRTKEQLMRCIGAFAISASLVSLYGVIQYFLGNVSSKWQDMSLFASLAGRVTSTFDNPNVLGEFLIMAAPFLLALLLSSGKFGARAVTFVGFALVLVCTVLTYSRGAWIGMIAGMFFFALVLTKKAIFLICGGIAAVPLLAFLLPESVVSRFLSIGNLSDSSTSFRLKIYETVSHLIGDWWGGGVGIGEGSFTAVYTSGYSFTAFDQVPHAHSLYLQLFAEIGIIGLIIFLLTMLFSLQSGITALRRETGTHRLFLAAGLASVVSFLVQSATDYTFYNYRIFLLFWLVTGLLQSAARIADDTREHRTYRPDDDLNYAELDVPLRESE